VLSPVRAIKSPEKISKKDYISFLAGSKGFLRFLVFYIYA